jgi:DNA-binding CsgD family transcriptional regulator
VGTPMMEKLSPRQREVLTLVIAGKTNPEIAGALGISRNTVAVHRLQGQKTLGVHSSSELLRLAASYGQLKIVRKRPNRKKKGQA